MADASKKKGFKPFLTKAEQEELAKKARLRRKAKARAAALQLEQDIREAQEEEIREKQKKRWNNCLSFLEKSVVKFAKNPWLFINHPDLTQKFLMCLDHVLLGFRDHAEDVNRIREVLGPVYDIFIHLSNFSMNQPSFYFTDTEVVRRLVLLCSQVAHKSNSKSLYPNILRVLLTTFKRKHLHRVFIGSDIASALLKWVGHWVPNDSCLTIILQSIHLLSLSEPTREMLLAHPGLERLQVMALGLLPGLPARHHAATQAALRVFPPPNIEPQEEESDELQTQQ